MLAILVGMTDLDYTELQQQQLSATRVEDLFFFYLLSNVRLTCEFPTNIASVHLVTGCPNARAGVKMVGKKKKALEQRY